MAAADPVRFGNLGVLPTEIRLNLWSQLGPYAPMMCANRQTYSEINSFIYDNLHITVEAHQPDDHNQQGDQPRRVPHSPTATTNYGAALPADWLNSTSLLQRIETFEFILRAPLSADPGQLLQFQASNTEIVSRITRKLKPQIRVRVIQSDARRWCMEDSWNRIWSAHEKDACDQLETAKRLRSAQHTDLEIALSPFLIEPRYGSVTVELPEDIYLNMGDTGNEFCLAENLAIGSPSKETGQTTFLMQQVGSGPPWRSHDDLLACLQERSLHRTLDNMPGPTAAILRRDRFANWSRQYEVKRYRQAWASWEPETDTPSACAGFWRDVHDFEDLYREMRAWNPWSIFHVDERESHAGSDDSQEAMLRREMKADQRHQDGWCKTTWAKRYPFGIPPRNSQAYREHVETYREREISDGVALDGGGIGHGYADIMLPERLGGWHQIAESY